MWYLLYPPFPEPQVLPVSPGFDITQGIALNINMLREYKEKMDSKAHRDSQLRVYHYTLYLYFIKTLQFIIPYYLLAYSFSNIKYNEEIYQIISSGYLFGQFVNILYDKHNSYEANPNKIYYVNNWKKAFRILKQDPALQNKSLFPEEYIFSNQEMLVKTFFKIMDDLLNLFLDSQQISKLKMYTYYLFLRHAKQRDLSEEYTVYLLSDEDFPIYLSRKLQNCQYPVNKPTVSYYSMNHYLYHYGIPNSLFNNDQNWRNGYYLFLLIKYVMFRGFKVKHPYKQMYSQGCSLSESELNNQNKQNQLSLKQVIDNLSLICSFLNYNYITQNTTVGDIQEGDYYFFCGLVQNVMNYYPYLKPINSQYDEQELTVAKKNLILELVVSYVLAESQYQPDSYYIYFAQIAEWFRSGNLIFDYLEHLYRVYVVKSPSIHQYINSTPHTNRGDVEGFVRTLLRYARDVVKIGVKYDHTQVINGSEELVVDLMEELVKFKYLRLNGVAGNYNKFLLRAYEAQSCFVERGHESLATGRRYQLLEETGAFVVDGNGVVVRGVGVDHAWVWDFEEIEYDFLE